MKINIVTYVDIRYGYNNGRPDVSVFTSKEDARVEYLGLIDPDIAQAYMRWQNDHDEKDRELAELAEKYLKDGVHYGDDYTVSIDEKEVAA